MTNSLSKGIQIVLLERGINPQTLPRELIENNELSFALKLGRPKFRVAIGRIDAPDGWLSELNMLCIGYLEQYVDLAVYRTMGTPATDLTGLDANWLLALHITVSGATYQLTFTLTNVTSDETYQESITSDDASLLSHCAQALGLLTNRAWGSSQPKRATLTKTLTWDNLHANATQLQTLYTVEQWVSGVTVPPINVGSVLSGLFAATDETVGWLIGNTLARLWLNGAPQTLQSAQDFVADAAKKTLPVMLLGRMAQRVATYGQLAMATQWLNILDKLSMPSSLATLLMDIYNIANKPAMAIDFCQDLIVEERADTEVQLKYAALIQSAAERNTHVSSLVFVEPEEFDTLTEALWSEALLALYEIPDEDLQREEVLLQLFAVALHTEDIDEILPVWESIMELGSHDEFLLRRATDELEYANINLQPLMDALQNAKQTAFMQLAYARLLYFTDESTALELPSITQVSDIWHDVYLQLESPHLGELRLELEAEIATGEIPPTADIQLIESVVDAYPKATDYILLLASIYEAQEDYSAAIELLLDGLKSDPENPELLLATAEMFLTLADDTLAQQYLHNALEMHPNHVGLLALIAEYALEESLDAHAKVYMQRIESINPNAPELKELRRRLSEL